MFFFSLKWYKLISTIEKYKHLFFLGGLMEYLRQKYIIDIETYKFLDDVYEPINENIEYELVTSDELVGNFKLNETNSEYVTVTYCKLYDATGISDGEVYEHFLDNSHFIKSNLSEVRNMYVDSLVKEIEKRYNLEIKNLNDESEVKSLMTRINNEIRKLQRKKR